MQLIKHLNIHLHLIWIGLKDKSAIQGPK